MAKLSRRWMIKGTLTTASPLHIGSGYHDFDDRLKKRTSDAKVKVAKVASNFEKRPYIPGSTLKGNLRSWARACQIENDPVIISLFGSLKADDANAHGGKADFFDCHAVRVNGIQHHPPYWSELPEWKDNASLTKWTGIMTSTQINRRTKTVADGKLFHTEYVPAGVTFEVRIGGQDTAGEVGYGEIEQLLALFEGFNSGDVTLGADSGNDFGHFSWTPQEILVFESNSAKKWSESTPSLAVGWAALEALTKDDADAHFKAAKELAITCGRDCLNVDITLYFEGGFLVNDPTRTGNGDELPNHAPLCDEQGRPWLPSSSFRGAFRSQAERILRTIGDDKAACYPDGDGPRETCRAVTKPEDIIYLCPACQIFGATGWRSPIEFTSFRPIEGSQQNSDVKMKQEFVGIDRFTGAASLGDNTQEKGKGAKFNAERFVKPTLNGTMKINLAALKKLRYKDAALGLIALGLRDLIEGDLTFGMGAGKGYGSCTAELGPKIVGDGVPESVKRAVLSLNGGFTGSPSDEVDDGLATLTAQITSLNALLNGEPYKKPERSDK